MISRAHLLALLAVAAMLFAVPAFMRDLWTPDEPRYALVAREMLHSGDWVVLQRNGEVYREKPPLLFWAIAAISAPLGDVNEITARAPSILAALLTLLLTYDLARRMFGPHAGLWSAMVLATTFRFWWQSNTGQIDMLLTACTTLSLYALWRWHESRQAQWPVAYHAGTALALLAKGPPALIFTLLGAVVSLWGRRDERRGLRLWLGVPLSIAPVAAWFYFSRQTGTGDVGGEVSGTFARQIMGRIFSGVSHSQPPWYYLKVLPIEWFPWILLLPWTIAYTWRTRREGPAVRLLLAWILPALIFFHIIVEKRALYLLPMYPALAILVARSLLALLDEGRYGWLRATAMAWVVFVAANVVSTFMVDYTAAAGGEQPSLYLFTVVAVMCFGWTCVIGWTKAWRHWPAAWVAQSAALLLAAGIGVFPVVNYNKGSKEFCAPVRTLARDGGVDVLSVRFLREEYVFYSEAKHRVVLTYPGLSTMGESGSEADLQRARMLRYAMEGACVNVPVADYVSPSPMERQALREAVEASLQEAGLSDNETQEYRVAVARDVAAVVKALQADTPVVLFSTMGDWQWILAFVEDVSFLALLKEQQVSSREMVLFANRAAQSALKVGIDTKDTAIHNIGAAEPEAR